MKRHLKRAVGSQTLTFEELSTVAAQIEAVMNSRPLSPLSSDPCDMDTLTPGHFLIGTALLSLPDKPTSHGPHQRWRMLQDMTRSFWEQWSRDYLSTLQQRQKWQKETDPLREGDLVLIKEDKVPPLQWAKGRITKVFKGNDDAVRVVQLKTSKGLYVRPVVKLIKLLSTADN